MKILDKIIEKLKERNSEKNSVFEIADVIKENVPQWIQIKNSEYLGFDFFEVLNVENDTLTICCNGELQDTYTVIIKINKNHEFYVHDFFLY